MRAWRKKERLEQAKAAIEKVELTHRMTHKPNELSGGQRQRVAIARALVNNPSILLADEPTGNLDSKTGVEIMALFARLHEGGNTIIVVTHEADIAAYAHRVIAIRDGQVERDVKQEPHAGRGPLIRDHRSGSGCLIDNAQRNPWSPSAFFSRRRCSSGREQASRGPTPVGSWELVSYEIIAADGTRRPGNYDRGQIPTTHRAACPRT